MSKALLCLLPTLTVAMNCTVDPSSQNAVWPRVVQGYIKSTWEAASHVTGLANVKHTDNPFMKGNSLRRRRSADNCVTRVFPLGDLTLNIVNINPWQYNAITAAFQYMMLMYCLPTDENPIDLTIVTDDPEPSDSAVIGMWNGVYIALYVNRISSLDMLFLVTVHEILHALTFNCEGAGGDSFCDLAPNQKYLGSTVVNVMGTSEIYTDTQRVHWQNDRDPFSFDVMEPILTADNVQVSRGTISATKDIRSTWTVLACDSADNCPEPFSNWACVNAGSNLAGYCVLKTNLIAPRPDPAQYRAYTNPVLFEFGFGALTAIALWLTCNKRRLWLIHQRHIKSVSSA